MIPSEHPTPTRSLHQPGAEPARSPPHPGRLRERDRRPRLLHHRHRIRPIHPHPHRQQRRPPKPRRPIHRRIRRRKHQPKPQTSPPPRHRQPGNPNQKFPVRVSTGSPSSVRHAHGSRNDPPGRFDSVSGRVLVGHPGALTPTAFGPRSVKNRDRYSNPLPPSKVRVVVTFKITSRLAPSLRQIEITRSDSSGAGTSPHPGIPGVPDSRSASNRKLVSASCSPDVSSTV
jgi:hypothetical protein